MPAVLMQSLPNPMVNIGDQAGYTALTFSTLPPVEVDPIFTIKTSCFASFDTFVCFLSSPVALTPSSRRRRK
jgi:hypothetical protein